MTTSSAPVRRHLGIRLVRAGRVSRGAPCLSAWPTEVLQITRFRRCSRSIIAASCTRRRPARPQMLRFRALYAWSRPGPPSWPRVMTLRNWRDVRPNQRWLLPSSRMTTASRICPVAARPSCPVAASSITWCDSGPWPAWTRNWTCSRPGERTCGGGGGVCRGCRPGPGRGCRGGRGGCRRA